MTRKAIPKLTDKHLERIVHALIFTSRKQDDGAENMQIVTALGCAELFHSEAVRIAKMLGSKNVSRELCTAYRARSLMNACDPEEPPECSI